MKQQAARADGLGEKLKESQAMNVRLREAVEELERRLQTNYEKNSFVPNQNYNESFDEDDDRIATQTKGVDIDFGGEQSTQSVAGGFQLNTQFEAYKELDCIDNIGDMTYHEKHAFNLEHLAGITCLIHLRLPTFMPLIDMNSHFGSMVAKRSNNNEE